MFVNLNFMNRYSSQTQQWISSNMDGCLYENMYVCLSAIDLKRSWAMI